VNSIVQDLTFALRSLRKSPGFTIVAVLTLALGIGANAAIFSLINAVLLRPLPFANSDRIASISESAVGLGFPQIPFSPPDLHEFMARQRSFELVAAYENDHRELSGDGGAGERIVDTRSSATLFPLLGVQPMLGRGFTAEDDAPGHAVAILSNGLWQRRYASDPKIIGKTIYLDREAYQVVGVMPRDFVFPMHGPMTNDHPADLFVPLALTPDELQAWAKFYNFTVIGRLKPGISMENAAAEANIVVAQILKMYPQSLLEAFHGVHVGAVVNPLQRDVVGLVRAPLLVLLVAVGLVLLIACANVANLLLARATARHKEIAIRAALGAGRWRLIRQLLSENILLGLISGAIGILIAYWGVALLLSLSPIDLPRVHEIGIDGRVLAFALGLSFLTALIFGLIPGIEASRTDPQEALKEGTRGASTSRSKKRLQGALIVAQMALSVMLLAAAGLVMRSFVGMLKSDPGFQPQRILAVGVPLPLRAYPRASSTRAFFEEMLRRAAALPQVQSAGASTDLPLDANEHDAVILEGRDAATHGQPPSCVQSWILGDYLRTMGIAILKGRGFTPEDIQGRQDVALVSAAAAQEWWPGEDPIGKRLKIGSPDWPWLTVVGVVNDVKDSSLQNPARPHTYTPYLQVQDTWVESPLFSGARRLNLVVRTQGDPAAFTSAVRKIVSDIDPAIAMTKIHTMNADVSESVAPQRFILLLLGIFAGLALFLAAVGVYGVLSYSVAQRTHEIGVRIALGAPNNSVLALVLMEGMRLTLAGALIGIAAALAVTRLMAGLLYGVTAHDPVTFIGVAAVMCGVALLACYVPARRAMRVDPMVALRYE
jgi:predicted permease